MRGLHGQLYVPVIAPIPMHLHTCCTKRYKSSFGHWSKIRGSNGHNLPSRVASVGLGRRQSLEAATYAIRPLDVSVGHTSALATLTIACIQQAKLGRY